MIVFSSDVYVVADNVPCTHHTVQDTLTATSVCLFYGVENLWMPQRCRTSADPKHHLSHDGQYARRASLYRIQYLAYCKAILTCI